MRSLILSLVLAVASLGVVGVTPTESQAQRWFGWRRGYYGGPVYYPGAYAYYPYYNSYLYPYAYPSYSYSYTMPYYSYYTVPGYSSYYYNPGSYSYYYYPGMPYYWRR
jgi:hypothetical protein